MNVRARIGLALLAILFVLAIGYPLAAHLAPHATCPLGQDVELARHTVCERTIGGLGSSLAVGLLSGGGALMLATLLALGARAAGGAVEQTILRAARITFALPDVLVLIGISFAARVLAREGALHLDPYALMIISLALVGWAGPMQMLVRRLESLERADFVTATFALGATRGRVIARHLLPMSRDFLLAIFLARVPAAILAESTVSFLGFGLPPEHASLGTYFGRTYRQLLVGEWRILLPVWILLVAIVVAFTWSAAAVSKDRASTD
jgi:peptide/nickel transport system permease protein